MTSSAGLPKALLIFGIVLPVAALVGYMLATPQDYTSIIAVGAVFGVLAIPVVLKWHRPLLIFSWNAALTLSFLPGSPYLWMPAAITSFFLVILNSVLNKEVKLVKVSSISWMLIAFAAVVLLTAKLTGGMGLRALGGSSYGGKKYFQILFAVAGYFALSLQRTPPEKVQFYGSLFTLSGLTNAMGNLVYYFPSLWFLYYLVPVDFALAQAGEDFSVGSVGARFFRLGGLGVAGFAGFTYLLMRFGVRGILDLTKWWRAATMVALLGLSMVGGFRSILVLCVLSFAVQYCVEGLLRSRWTFALILGSCILVAMLTVTSRYLPVPIQRSLSVLPFDIDPVVRADALASSDWRLRMWKLLLPEVPNHLILGKGFTANASDYILGAESWRRGFGNDIDQSILAGDYHNGPLSVLIPFGIWGLLAFIGFNFAAVRVLYLNYVFADSATKQINSFLLAAYLTRLIFFCTIYGAIQLDLAILTGIVGLNVSINGGVRKAPVPGQALAA